MSISDREKPKQDRKDEEGGGDRRKTKLQHVRGRGGKRQEQGTSETAVMNKNIRIEAEQRLAYVSCVLIVPMSSVLLHCT